MNEVKGVRERSPYLNLNGYTSHLTLHTSHFHPSIHGPPPCFVSITWYHRQEHDDIRAYRIGASSLINQLTTHLHQPTTTHHDIPRKIPPRLHHPRPTTLHLRLRLPQLPLHPPLHLLLPPLPPPRHRRRRPRPNGLHPRPQAELHLVLPARRRLLPHQFLVGYFGGADHGY